MNLLEVCAEYEKYASDSMHQYKFRAECRPDVDRLHKVLSAAHIEIIDWHIAPQTLSHKGKQFPIPDVEVSFKTNVPLQTIQHAMRLVPDSHVMIETIQPIGSFSGERIYERMAPKLEHSKERSANTLKYAAGYTHPLQERWVRLVKELKSLTDLADSESDPFRLSACMHKIRHLSDEGIKLIDEVLRINRIPMPR